MELPRTEGFDDWKKWADSLIVALQKPQEEIYPVPKIPKANLKKATPPGIIVYIPDETGGGVIAFSDGTNWRRVTDRAIVS